jgi:chemotaxis signal transduction protein
MPETASSRAGLVVRAGGVRWFIPVAAVIEVVRHAAVSRIPAAAAVLGLVNHRGRVLAVGDAARALGLAVPLTGDADLVVVELAGGRRFAVAVETVIELVAEPRTGLAPLDLDAVAAAIFA